ncbi:MAG TPA: hypothetical protein VLS49_07505 [Usitatibacter sp.]|nr:hypothetical protein [Usitatibacter sp.]
MTPGRRRRSVRAVLVLLSIGLAVLAHFTIVRGFSPALGAILSLVPAGLLALSLARRSRRRAWMVVAAALAAAGLWAEWGALERHFPDVFLVEHVGVNLALAVVFGRTLVAGREPLCTRFARLLHQTLPPEVAAYTRRVTLAWTLFFATVAALSVTLYAAGFLEAWSLLATVLSPVLLALMFAAEYAVRLRALPNWERVGLLSGIRAFSRHFATAPAENPR